ncbi:hypothetical protein ONS95_009367 [Cadophora gregata]|uniref:uncharacterized protein n=1 Tax=Cadophora gregata TaxID=51156 RepID=UPI0026DB1D9E|nr:uncharacterized protein ONS95_009367 [Cadophora gregata]KAK0124406.1 hypothetical protein ONS95_009367 [Cadophora gregata]KAK0129742.1 hypothetical protein ONS96_000298 [Cadophora gregata f. sp. sojae]
MAPFVDKLDPFVLYGPSPQAPNGEDTPPSLTDPLTTVTLTIGQGSNMRTYTLFQEFASYHSPMLAAGFNGPFRESQTRHMVIDDFQWPEIFGNVQHWMYTRTLCGPNDAKLLTSGLCLVWILADRLIMPKLQNDVMDELFTKRGPSRPLPLICWLYKIPIPDGKLRELWVDRWAFECNKGGAEGEAGDLVMPAQFLLDVSLAYERDGRELRNVIAIGGEWGRAKGGRRLLLEDYLVDEQ